MTEPCTCTEALRAARVEGSLTAAAAAELDGHLLGCAACREDLAGNLAVVCGLSLPPVTVEDARALWDIPGRTAVAWRHRLVRRRAFTGTFAAAAAALLALVAVPRFRGEAGHRPAEAGAPSEGATDESLAEGFGNETVLDDALSLQGDGPFAGLDQG